MEHTDKEKFEELWKDFSSLVRGKLVTTARKQTLSAPLANLILSDAVGTWGEEYSVYGRWMHGLEQNDSSKAGLVRGILLGDMRFTDIETGRVLPAYCDYLIPGLGACAGWALSGYMEYGKIAQVASVLVPAALLYPVVRVFRNNQMESAVDKSIECYMAQLGKFRNSVVSVLS